MKIFLSISLLIFFTVSISLGQHNANQQQFKKSSLRTPRYRNEENDKSYFANGLNQMENYQKIGINTNNEMLLECSALMNVKADSYLAIFNLTQVAPSAKDADDLIAKRIAAFTEGLKSLGIQSTDVYSDMIYLIPIFEFEVEKKLFSKTYNEVPKGFEMQKNIHIRFKRSEIIDDIVTLAASNEIYDLVTVEYFVKDSQLAYDSLRLRAVNFIAKNANRFEKIGLKLDGEFRVVVEKTGVVYPESQYSDYEAFVSQSLDAAKDKTVTTIRKPKTVAYNKLPYDEFDIVINPEFLEPVVQYTYKLQVKYTLNKEKLEPKNHYFILDNNGNMKEIIVK